MAKIYVAEKEWFDRMYQSFKEGKDLNGYVVFSNENVERGIWDAYGATEDGMWPLEERTYEVWNGSKYFNPEMCGTSIFAGNLANTDHCKLSDYWLHNGVENWIAEAFYFEEE